MLHFGELDAHIPMSAVNEVAAAHPDVIVHTYDADHGFHCDQRGSYEQTSATLAWSRTLEFFAQHL
jgi:carboxymethylenebutenolidase